MRRTMKTMMILLALGLCMALGTPVATAAERPMVLVLPLPARDVPLELQDQALALVARELRKQYKVRVWSGRAVRRAVFGVLGSGLEEAAMALEAEVEAGRFAYQNLQIGKAIGALKKAKTRTALCGPEIRDAEPLVNLHLYYGLALLAQGNTRQAAGEFRQAVALRPELTLDTKRFPPDVVSTFTATKRQLLSGSPVQVQFQSKPAGAEVWLDGRRLGNSPLTAPVYPGTHYVRFDKEGHSPWTLKVEGVPPESLRARLVPTWTGGPPEDLIATAIAREDLSQAVRAKLKMLAGFYRVDAILLVSVVRQGNKHHLGQRLFMLNPELVTRARLFNLGTTRTMPRKVRGVVSTLSKLKKLKASASANLVAAPAPVAGTPKDPRVVVAQPVAPIRQPVAKPRPGPIPGPKPEPGPVAVGSSTAWYKSWWFWTLTGVVVAGAAAGVTVWQLQPEPSWTLEILPSQ